jgi:hypothetical protein
MLMEDNMDIDVTAEQLVAGEQSCDCPYLQDLVEGVREGDISMEDLKAAMRESLNEVV